MQTVAVKAVLISYDFRHANCESVGNLPGFSRKTWNGLKANGHPKWKSVDLDYPLKGWEQYGCVTKYLQKAEVVAPPPQAPSEPNPVLDAVKEMLNP